MDVLNSTNCSGLGLTPFYSIQTLTATFSGATGTLTMVITDPSGTSTFAGVFRQYGSIYQVSGSLTIGVLTLAAVIDDFTSDDDGIRGNLIARGPNGCLANYRFSAVRPG
jgi:hypothetical protein